MPRPPPNRKKRPRPPATPCPIEAGERDLTLKVGTILPQSGTLAFLGPPEEAGVALAAKEINEADMGITIEVVYRDSGDTTTDIATVSVTDLLSQDVSAIIGAASSGVSFTVIDQITSAGVVQFSPANTSPDFTDYEDSGLYFRTAPSDLLQGEVLGNQIAEDGASTLGLLVLNDPYGTGLAAATKESFEAAGGEVVAEELFNTGDSNFDAQLVGHHRPRTPTPWRSSPSMRPRSSCPRLSVRATPATSCTSSTATWPTTARTSRPA